MNARPLQGVRVLDITSVVSGPTTTLRLAQYGAVVIKVEPPEGDLMRHLGGASPSGTVSGQFLHLNRGKRTAAFDLKNEADRQAVLAILETCDVLVSNMRPEALARLGFDAAALRTSFPRLIHCVITGFGPGGPYRGRPAYDSVIQGAAGVVGLHLARDGQACFAPLLLCDRVIGEITAGAIMAALLGRARTGTGSAVEVPMQETMAAFVLQEHLSRATFEPPMGAVGDSRVLSPATRPARTSDGWITVTANTDDQCDRLLRTIGREDLVGDPRFANVSSRVANLAEWLAIRDERLATRTSEEWLAEFTRADLPVMPCHTLDSLLLDPHLTAVQLLSREEHPSEGTIRAIRPTILFDGEAAAVGQAPAEIGRDTADVLAALGKGSG